MTRIALLALALTVPAAASAVELADEVRGAGHFGIGLGGGLGPSGLSGKVFFTDATSLQLVVGASGHHPHYHEIHNHSHDESLGLDLDFLFEMPDIAQASDVLQIGWELGLGGWLGFGDHQWLGVNGVAGLQFNFMPAPIDITIEYKPGLLLTPEVDFILVNFGGHIRIWFM